MEHTKNIKLVLFGYILFAIASVYSFAQEFYGMEYPDTFYYANVFMQQGHIEVMYPLTQGVFCLLHRIGDGLIYTKIGNWLAYYLACVILCVGTIKLWPQYKHIALICTSFAVLCLPIYETTACNGNALSSLFLTGVLVTLLYFRDNLLNLKGVILAVCIGMSVLARFPNIVIIPLLVLLMPLICKCRKEYGVYTLALLGGLVFYILVCVLLDHGWYNFLNAFNNNLTVATDTDAMDHSVSFLLGVYLKDLKDIISFMKYLSLITILPILVFSFISRKYIRITLNALFALLFFGYLYKKIGMFKSETWTLQIMLVAILLLFNYILLVLAMARHNVRIAIITALPVVCGLAAMAGSDSGLAYMLPILLASVPLTLSQMKVALQETKPNEKILLIISR